jgi:predicted RNA-binding Zn-ribbon protein involved in translation (DUF1610 family)
MPNMNLGWRYGRIVLASLLVLGALMAWLRSYLPPTLEWRSHDGRLMLFFSDGRLGFINPDDRNYEGVATMNAQLLAPMDEHFRWWGFEYAKGNWALPTGEEDEPGWRLRPFRMVALPYWAITIVAAIPMVLTARSHRVRGYRMRTGRCLHCGYDLRFTTTRCPECGTVAAARSADGMSPATG